MTRKSIIIIVSPIVVIGGLYYLFFSAPGGNSEPERFVVPLNATRSQTIKSLSDQRFIKTSLGVNIALLTRGKFGTIAPGGYKISKNQNAFQTAGILTKEPYMKWAVIPEGERKEQIANQLSKILGWNNETKNEFLNGYMKIGQDYKEGVYFPDTYLLPKDETGEEIALRFIAHFQNKFGPLYPQFTKDNVRWPTAIKIASLIEREAGKNEEMPLVAGIIWNRLLQGMPLAIDATIQYAKGNAENGWWTPLVKGDTKLDSLYNTYFYKGLPPTPISNPGLPAIEAVLKPEKTSCLYYLHDNDGIIHCSKTYAEHQANIEKYLK
ncbi:MAG: endolytic transglycosylase MltG [Patescibacteria group bacterium]